MRTYLKWAAVSLLSAFLLAVGLLYGLTELRFRKTYTVRSYPVAVRSDAETIARGRHIATTRRCIDCHGGDLGGRTFLDTPILAQFFSSNLTAGEGGVGARYTEADWEKAIRQGIRPDGRPLLFMPSHDYYPLGDEDLSAIVSFIRGLPSVDRPPTRNRVGPLGRFLILSGQVTTFVPAELIDHEASRPTAPRPGITIEYGAYLATSCTGCHGERLAGGRIPGAPPEFLPTANLTPHETGLAVWSVDDFVRLMREGRRPDGSSVDEQMPWPFLGQLSDDELRALWLYLRSIEPLAYGSR